MHSKSFAVAALASVATAAPQSLLSGLGGGGNVQNDLQGACKPILFINARATGERGNFGNTSGPALCSALKQQFAGQVGCQGVGGGYTASLMDNVSLRGTSAAAQQEAQSMFTQAVQKCPNVKIVASGFSQGSAVMNSAISGLPKNVQQNILGVVLYGYTKNKQNGGKIQNFPPEKVLTYCESSDGVCDGGLSVTAGHFAYIRNGDFGRGAQFLAQQIQNNGAGGQAGAPVSAQAGGAAGAASGGSSRLSGLRSSSSSGGSSLLSGLRGRLSSS